jgi:hypothetical protein
MRSTKHHPPSEAQATRHNLAICLICSRLTSTLLIVEAVFANWTFVAHVALQWIK